MSNIKDPELKTKLDEITADEKLSHARKRVAAGKAVRETCRRLKEKGLSNAAIAEQIGLTESRVRQALKPVPRGTKS